MTTKYFFSVLSTKKYVFLYSLICTFPLFVVKCIILLVDYLFRKMSLMHFLWKKEITQIKNRMKLLIIIIMQILIHELDGQLETNTLYFIMYFSCIQIIITY